MPRLFTKFATKSETGTRLGLYISKRIIEARGGRIWAENRPEGVSAKAAGPFSALRCLFDEAGQHKP